VAPEKVDVTYLAAKPRADVRQGNAALLWQRLGIRSPYVLAFSSQSPHKNVAGLLRAFAKLDLDRPIQLVLVGYEPERGQSLRSLVTAVGVESSVVFTGYLPDDELHMLLKKATAFAFPSFYEGFGIPVLEAMGAGIPVVSSNVASLPEVVGKAGILFDPSDIDAMASALRTVLSETSFRKALVAEGFHQAARFTWRETATRTLEIYEKVHALRQQGGQATR
jgi:glycosyltransferase involved in cell wall biosynthesis